MIPASVIEDIRSRCDIEQVISSYVTLKRAGNTLKGLCPFHSERTPSFTVYPGTQSFYCFGCGAGGDVINFVMRTENLDYVSAVETLAKRAGIDLPDFDEKGGQPRGVTRSRVLAMNLEAAKYYRHMLFDDELGAPGRQYLLDRGMSMAAIKRFGLGYAPEYGSLMARHLQECGYTEEEMRTAYLANRGERGLYDYYRARVIFPILDVSGNVIAFGGRIIDSSKSERKYLNSSDTPAFKKTKNLYALNYAKNAEAPYFILCEGYMDVIALHDAGFGMAVASLGTAFTEEQARIISKYVKRVVLCYDSDEAGQKATDKAIRILENVGVEPKILKMDGAKDPDEYIKTHGADAFRKLLEESRGKYDFLLDGVREKYDLSVSAEKVKAVAEVCAFIAGIYSHVERDIYIERTAREFSVDRLSVQHDVEKRRQMFSQTYEKKRRGELLRVTAGLNDRVNPDYAKQPKAARMEESILGMIFLHLEYLRHAVDGEVLREDEFPTAFGRRLFRFMQEREADGGFNSALLNEAFTPEEVSRVYQMMAERSELSVNDETSFETYVRAMREESLEGTTGKALSLEELLRKKRSNLENREQ